MKLNGWVKVGTFDYITQGECAIISLEATSKADGYRKAITKAAKEIDGFEDAESISVELIEVVDKPVVDVAVPLFQV